MRKLFGLFLAGALTLVVAGPAKAVLLPANATFSIEIGTFPPVNITLAGSLDATTTPGSNILGFTVPSDTFTATFATPVSPAVALLPPFVSLTGVSISAQNLDGSFNTTGGVMGVGGVANLLLHAYTAGQAATLPLTGALGITGTVTAQVLALVPLTIKGNGYTTGVASAVSTPLGGTAQATLTRQGAAPTTSLVGTERITNITYVTPTQIIITGISNIAAFGTLSVSFTHAVPEPGTLLLLGTGVAGLALVGRRVRK